MSCKVPPAGLKGRQEMRVSTADKTMEPQNMGVNSFPRRIPGTPSIPGTADSPLYTSDFNLTVLANFANSFGMQMLVATLPVYVISLGGSQTDAGLVSGALAFTALLFRPLMGWLTDSWRRRPLVLIGTSCYGFASLIYLLTYSIPLLLWGRFVHGFGLSCYTTASTAYIADIAPLQRRAEAVGVFAAAQAMGLIIGPAIGFMIVGMNGFHRLFYFSGGLAFTAFFISIFAKERREPEEIKKRNWSIRTGILTKEALPLTWMALCMGMGFGAVNSFIAIFARSRGFHNPGFYFMIQALALLISRIFTGRLADRYGRHTAIIPGFILGALALALLPFANSLSAFVLSASLFGFGFGAAQPATLALLIDSVQPEQRGFASSTYYMGFDGGISIGSILLGAVSQYLGFGIMWPIASGCILLGLAGFFVEKKRNKTTAK
jgi:MFS family permease